MPITTEGCQGEGGKYYDNWIQMLTGKPMLRTQNTIKREDFYERLPDGLIYAIQEAVPEGLGGDGWYKGMAKEFGVAWTRVRNYYLCEHNRYFGTQVHSIHRPIPKKQEFVRIPKEEYDTLLACKEDADKMKEEIDKLQLETHNLHELVRAYEKKEARQKQERHSNRWMS